MLAVDPGCVFACIAILVILSSCIVTYKQVLIVRRSGEKEDAAMTETITPDRNLLIRPTLSLRR